MCVCLFVPHDDVAVGALIIIIIIKNRAKVNKATSCCATVAIFEQHWQRASSKVVSGEQLVTMETVFI